MTIGCDEAATSVLITKLDARELKQVLEEQACAAPDVLVVDFDSIKVRIDVGIDTTPKSIKRTHDPVQRLQLLYADVGVGVNQKLGQLVRYLVAMRVNGIKFSHLASGEGIHPYQPCRGRLEVISTKAENIAHICRRVLHTVFVEADEEEALDLINDRAPHELIAGEEGPSAY